MCSAGLCTCFVTCCWWQHLQSVEALIGQTVLTTATDTAAMVTDGVKHPGAQLHQVVATIAAWPLRLAISARPGDWWYNLLVGLQLLDQNWAFDHNLCPNAAAVTNLVATDATQQPQRSPDIISSHGAHHGGCATTRDPWKTVSCTPWMASRGHPC